METNDYKKMADHLEQEAARFIPEPETMKSEHILFEIICTESFTDEDGEEVTQREVIGRAYLTEAKATAACAAIINRLWDSDSTACYHVQKASFTDAQFRAIQALVLKEDMPYPKARAKVLGS